MFLSSQRRKTQLRLILSKLSFCHSVRISTTNFRFRRNDKLRRYSLTCFTPNLQPDLSGNPFLRRLKFYLN